MSCVGETSLRREANPARGEVAQMIGRGPLAGLLLVAAFAFAAPAGAAEVPRWVVTATTNPTHVLPHSPSSAAQEIVTTGTGGTFKLSVETPLCEGAETTEPIALGATAAEVQVALEALSCAVQRANVEVTGGPGGTSPYLVNFLNELASQPIRAIKADGASLTGVGAGVSVVEQTRGSYAAQMTVTATNVGGAASDGKPITLSDALPPSVSGSVVTGYDAYASGSAFAGSGGAEMTCSPAPVTTASCEYAGAVDAGDSLVMTVTLDAGGASGMPAMLANSATVSGGGASEASDPAPLVVDASPAPFGPAPGAVHTDLSNDSAGGHANVNTAFTLSTSDANGVAANAKDIRLDLPRGLVASAVDLPQCTMHQVLEGFKNPNACPSDTMVGTAMVTLGTGEAGPRGGPETVIVPVYNIAPAPGEPFALAFDGVLLPVRMDTSILSNGDFSARVTVSGLSEAAVFLSAVVTIWGVPADHSGPGANGEHTLFGQEFGGPNGGETRVPLLTNPQQCAEALSGEMSADSWSRPGVFEPAGVLSVAQMTSCDQLSFEPSISMIPDTFQAGAPAGYTLDMKVPQDASPDGVATPDVRGVQLMLPPGTVLSPSGAAGLTACSDEQFFGRSHGTQEPAAPAACPRESQIGVAEVRTPTLPLPLRGSLFVGQPECEPCTPEDAASGRLLHLLLEVRGEGESAIVVKLAGTGSIDQQTGQITVRFDNDPQLPLSELRLSLGGGERATLSNPRACGAVRTTGLLTPWSAPETTDAAPFSEFQIEEGCFGPQFTPSFLAGIGNIQAGSYGALTVSFGRGDSDQYLSRLEMRLPRGLLGRLSTVPRCHEPQAGEGTCGADSAIGHAQVLLGPGSQPLSIEDGQVFLTDGYGGAPFGLSIVVPTTAGPYGLAGTNGRGAVVVRARLEVDSTDAHVTIRSDALPTAVDGIPLQLRRVTLAIDRPGFMVAPTNCAKRSIAATLTSSEGAAASVSSAFQVGNCGTLPFTPRLSASTQARTSKLGGASLHIKLLGVPGQANPAKIRVQLPIQLPTRLTTLQQACTDRTFAADPATCPAASAIGTASVSTPVLARPLAGPAYLVSHGGVAFPDIEIVLQGEGVTLVLDGHTTIHGGVTSSSFEAVPDVPIGVFDLSFPEGPHSILGANLPARARRSMCAQKLVMPTQIAGQNGALVKQSRRVTVLGCRHAKVTRHRGRRRQPGRPRAPRRARTHRRRG
jgi:hypothetical protein